MQCSQGKDVAAMLREALFDDLASQGGALSGLWPTAMPSQVLNVKVDWSKAAAEYLNEKIAVIDDFFSEEASHALCNMLSHALGDACVDLLQHTARHVPSPDSRAKNGNASALAC
eukprot:4486519-Amphidinium_carterae.2